MFQNFSVNKWIGLCQYPKIARILTDSNVVDRPCPYQGLSTFQEEHHKYFFGREVEIQTLMELVHKQLLVAVI